MEAKQTQSVLPIFDINKDDNKLVFSTAQGLMYDEKKLWYDSLNKLYPGMDVAQFVNSGINSIMIMNILRNMTDHDVSIHSCNSMIAFLQHLTNHLATHSLTNKHVKQDDTISYTHQKIWNNGAYLVAMFCLTLSSFHRAFNDIDYQFIIQNCFKMWQNWHCKQKQHQVLTCSEFDKLMQTSSDIRLKQMVDAHIVTNVYNLCLDLFDSLCGKDENESSMNLQIKESNIWLLLGLLRLHLLFPARFFDPNLKFQIRLDDVESLLTQLFEEIELRKRIELFHSGKSSNYTIHNLQQKYKLLLKDRSTLLSKVTFRPEADLTFADFWHELTNFINNQFEYNEIIQLFVQFRRNDNGDGNYTYQRIQSTLQTSLNFIQRLNDKFSHFNDFVAPIIDAIELVRYGLSYCIISCNASSSIITNGIKQLLSPISPSINHSLTLLNADLHQIIQKNCDFINKNNKNIKKSTLNRLDGKKLSSKLLLSGLKKSINFISNTGHSAQHITYDEVEVFDHWFSLFAHLYHEQEEQRRLQQQEKQSFYKFDSKAMEEETKTNFWELFPDYLLDFRHLTASKTLHHKTQMKKDFAKLESRLVQDPTIMEKHQQIMDKQQTQQQLDDLLIDENTIKASCPQFAFNIQRKTHHKFVASLSIQDIKEIFKHHLYVFSNSAKSPRTTVSGAMMKEISESLSSQHRIAGILTELLSVKQSNNTSKHSNHYNHGITVDNTVDDIGHISYLLSSTDLFTRFTSMSKASSCSSIINSNKVKFKNPIDVYTQSVPSYVRLVEKPLQALSVRIAGLLTAYPSHSVLLQLSELCSHLSSLSIRSPIMKVLTGLELLLSKAKSDWEDTCAARHTSIQTQLNPIFKLIGFWRKLELQSWSAIFQRKEQDICDAAINNWFYLYSLIHTEEISDDFIEGILENRKAKEKKTLHHEESFVKYASSLNPEQIFGVKAEEILERMENARNNKKEAFSKDEKSKIFLQEMFNHLNEFLENAPIGEIDIRLVMMHSFYQQINCELYTKYAQHRIKDKQIRIQLLRMIGNLIDYHSQFDSVITEHKKERFQPIKAKLKELVKFSKWDLRNYWQLRESAHKSHRKLARLCYDWKIALKRSVSGILAEIDTKETNEAAKDDPKIEFGKAEMYMKILKKNKFLKRVLSKKKTKRNINDIDTEERYQWLVENPSVRNEQSVVAMDLSVGSITKLLEKMDKLQRRFYSHSHWKNRVFMQNDVETLCSSIIITTKEYANKDIPFPRKQRVLSVLLQHLKQNGLKLFAPGDIDYLLPAQLFLNNNLSSKDALFVMINHAFNTMVGYNNNDKYKEWFETMSEKAQEYYQNVVRKMCQLRARRMFAHPDILQEANKCYGVTERLLSSITCQRNSLDGLLKQITTLQQWYINIKYELNETKTDKQWRDIPSHDIEALFWKMREKLTIITQCVNTLTAVYSKVISISKQKNKKQNQSKKSIANQIFDSDDLAQFEESIPDFIADNDYEDGIDCNKINDPIIQSLIQSKTFITKEYDAALVQIKQITSILNKYQHVFDEIATHKLSPQQYESMHHTCYTPFWCLYTSKQLYSIHGGLNTIYDSLQSLPCFNNLNINIQFETLKAPIEDMEIENSSNGLNEDYMKCYESVIEEIQFCIQDVIHLVDASEFNPPNTSTDPDDALRENVENKYFSFQQQSVIGITKAFHGEEIAHKLQKLIGIIHCMGNNSIKRRILKDSLHNLLVMIGGIIDIGRFALNHNINCHKSFCKLDYVLTSLFNGLFVKGFCKKDEEKEAEGDGDQMSQELGDGVGMADGKGIEDVSHEMENEGQVEGLKNDNKQQTEKDDKEKRDDDDDDIGVEMEQDFDGELEDVEEEPDQRNKGDDSEDDIEDIDREIGDIDFNKSQAIDERMWGSDDEEQQDEDDINKGNEKDEKDETDRNDNQELDRKDQYSQVQAKQNQDEDENSKDNKPDSKQDENEDEEDDTQKEEQTARLEFGDKLEDLDENVSDEEAVLEKKDTANDDEDNDEFDDTFPRKDLKIDDNMDIDISESEDGNGGDDDNNDDDEFDPKSLEEELAEKDKEREQEKLEDLQRGAGEIMPPNQPKDEELEFVNDGEEDDDDDGDEEENELNENNQEIMDIDKENEEQKGNELEAEIDEKGEEEQEEDVADINAASNPDILKANVPDIDENNKEHNEENEEKEDEEEVKQNEDDDDEDVDLHTEHDDNDENNDEAMGVYGGMGDTAPVGDDDDDDKDDDVEMQDDDHPMEQQSSDIYGDDEQMMMEDTSKGEWQPMNQESKKERDSDKKRNEQKKKEIEDKSNPFRSLGDALSEWKQRLDMIEQDEHAQKEEVIADECEDKDGDDDDDEEDNIDGDQYAHVPEDMNVENETQALMDNQDDEDLTHLPNINEIHKEEAFDEADNDNDPFDDEDELMHDRSSDDDEDKFDPYKQQKNSPNNQDDEEHKNDLDSKQNEVKLKDLRIENNENDDETKQSYLDYIQELLQDKDEEDVSEHTDTDYLDANMNEMKSDIDHNHNDDKDIDDKDDEEQKTDDNGNEEEDGPTAVEIAELRETLDERLSEWHQKSSQNTLRSGDEIWRKLCLVTNSLSQQLAEELRTILEPLQMTKLGGDFRTGKRINMKRVIPYIASQFRKDKIWLRRCKPHKRNYQILVCIDDSESMRDNKAGRLALESMCILTRALNKLEVGSIGVLSFGQTINLLHSLQRPFSDECGSFVCSQFSFAQKETKYQDLIATIINILSNNDTTWKNIQQHIKQFNGGLGSKKNKMASLSGPSVSVSWDGSETLSLIFIISDARIQQDRKRLEQLVRVAHERKQIVVLIIVDTNDETTSIVNFKTIDVDPLTNTVKISNYLDEFPFPYYVLLKDIQTLPNVVADSLRQWFELVRQSS